VLLGAVVPVVVGFTTAPEVGAGGVTAVHAVVILPALIAARLAVACCCLAVNPVAIGYLYKN
jgi:hypothetical protein